MGKTGQEEASHSSKSSEDLVVGCSSAGRGKLVVLVESYGEHGIEGVSVRVAGMQARTTALGQADFTLDAGTYEVQLAFEKELAARYDPPDAEDRVQVQVQAGGVASVVYLVWAATWIELRDLQTGEPVAHARWAVSQKSGGPITGTLDDKGRARVYGLSGGSFQVAFPDYDKSLWSPAPR